MGPTPNLRLPGAGPRSGRCASGPRGPHRYRPGDGQRGRPVVHHVPRSRMRLLVPPSRTFPRPNPALTERESKPASTSPRSGSEGWPAPAGHKSSESETPRTALLAVRVFAAFAFTRQARISERESKARDLIRMYHSDASAVACVPQGRAQSIAARWISSQPLASTLWDPIGSHRRLFGGFGRR